MKRMMFPIAVVAALVGASVAGSEPDSIDRAMNGMVTDLEQRLPAGTTVFRVCVEPLVSELSRGRCTASVWLDRKLRHFVSVHSRFAISTRESTRFQETIRVRTRGGGGRFLEKELEQGAEPELTLHGTYMELGDGMVSVGLVLAEPLRMHAVVTITERTIAMDAFPSKLTFEPLHLTPEQAVQNQELASTVLPNSGQFEVTVRPSEGERGVYHEGDYLSLMVKATRDCYIRLYHVDPDGMTRYLFPKAWRDGQWAPAVTAAEQMRLEAGEVYVLPYQEYGSLWEVSEPFGLDRIKVVASTVPFGGDPTAGGTGLIARGRSGAIFSRGLVDKTLTAEGWCSFRSEGK